METTLLIVTSLSLIVALVMSFTAWRLGREERRRTAARVAALSAAAGISPAELGITSPHVDHVGPRSVDLPKAPWAPAPRSSGDTGSDQIDKPKGLSPRDGLSPGEGLPPRDGLSPRRAQAEQNEPLFDDRLNPNTLESRPILGSAGEARSSGGRQRRLAAAAALLFVVLVGGLLWTMASREPSVASAAAPTSPLELVSLRHERASSKLAVSGLVRNPASGHPVDRLAAVVFLFDQQGAFVTSAKAPVDFVRLGSGDESPFVVTLDAPATVARYRVSFRTDQGIVPHVDRRGASPIAAQAEQAASVQMK